MEKISTFGNDMVLIFAILTYNWTWTHFDIRLLESAENI